MSNSNSEDVEWLKGMVGFCDWHLRGGKKRPAKTVQEVFAMLERSKQFRNVPPEQYTRAIEIALMNARLCEACNQRTGTVTAEDHELWQQGEDLGRKVTMAELLSRLGFKLDFESSSKGSQPDAGQPSQPSQ